ncbi:MAG: leucyl aminopeptidase [Rhizobiaceae bacterium]|nr:leucyl aminopeptidase [Rhizobiaceae bacterium]
MAPKPTISFTRFAVPRKGAAILLSSEDAGLGEAGKACDPGEILPRAFSVAGFKGKSGTAVDVLAPAGSPLDRIVVVGTGKSEALSGYGWTRLGGSIAGQFRKAGDLTVVVDAGGTRPTPADVAELAAGILLRAYNFDTYKTRRDEASGEPAAAPRVTIQCANPTATKRAFAQAEAIAESVWLARDLVNEPANILGPVEVAAKARALEALGVKVEILTEKEMRRLGMGALLGVAQGSVRPPRLVVMQWNGGKPKDRPVAFVGKGVTFDSGGISIKPAGGMEDMKGDMGGAAAVIGLMHALAARGARANVVGVVGCVENMVDGNAQRPGDIVTSMSGQTIEVINTDAEGRLVLADALWYCNERFQPRIMVDLATLTGAVIVSLGAHHAGLFSNSDELADRLLKASSDTQERLWRLPLGPEYDKLIDTKNADMKNTGGRNGGAITGAQFLQRFVKDTPWAHLDIAGTAMGAPASEINQSWGSGFGVRLLDRLVRDHYES